MTEPARPPSDDITCVISDIDGTLVTNQKALCPSARAAVAALRARGIAFSIASSRPPRGMIPLIHALGIDTPVAGFDGGMIVKPDLTVIDQHLLNAQAAQRAIQILVAEGVQVWVFSGQDWLVQDLSPPEVAQEIRTVRFQPTVVKRFDAALNTVGKIVGVSSDPDLLAHCAERARELLAGEAAVASPQPDRIDITHLEANKGASLLTMARLLGIAPAQIAVIGDGGNDVAAFEQAGLSIAMGNARPEVKAAADFVTDSNEANGFAHAIERFILAGERTPAAPSGRRDRAQS